ncbi:MAG: mechanosensitive ion channel protein MscS [Betaproteobacteria bacterium HGW-Betaproteobacteria-13]|jgi:MscS family membrane protein|uniref:Mechanosensitive ion channel protein MscS n=1 Tax=Parazoarcus communis TaxID=41977 RepID=A0A2U8H168_9RHOO|nr:mechanosensitive ion channel family protein [Parazoarcus communis]AWI79729.1 mechanosensitive ion channel protein MscS [Parazoarcus communis]PKO81687.1 MAG: mechanosensitive ion channel protein MscS [Betaproteobacteria bacterium HGW-Betaproteobacteria-13]
MNLDSLESWLKQITGGDALLALVLQVFLVVLVVVVANFFLRRVLARLEERTRLTTTPWDFALVSAARKPLTLLAWIVGITFAARIVQAHADAALFEAIAPVRTIGVIGCITWFLVRFISNVQDGVMAQRLAQGESVDRTTVDAIGKLLRISVLITAVLVGLQSLGFSISGVLAFGGVGGIAVGFAAKDLLANFFGGLMVYLDRPFVVGEWIRSPDKEIEGTVEEIGWRLTRIRTFDKRPLYVPNSVFTQITVENPSRMSNRRIKETVGLRYADIDKVAPIVRDIKAMLRAHPDIDQAPTMIVNFTQFAASSLDIMVYTFTVTTAWVAYHEVKQDVMLKIAEIVERHGAEIAFPTRTLHVEGAVDTVSVPSSAPVAG